MYGAIFGFQRLARCPKCTPASMSSLTSVSATCDYTPCSASANGGHDMHHAPRDACFLTGSVRNTIQRHRHMPSPVRRNIKQEGDLKRAETFGERHRNHLEYRSRVKRSTP